MPRIICKCCNRETVEADALQAHVVSDDLRYAQISASSVHDMVLQWDRLMNNEPDMAWALCPVKVLCDGEVIRELGTFLHGHDSPAKIQAYIETVGNDVDFKRLITAPEVPKFGIAINRTEPFVNGLKPFEIAGFCPDYTWFETNDIWRYDVEHYVIQTFNSVECRDRALEHLNKRLGVTAFEEAKAAMNEYLRKFVAENPK